ncbi:MAG: transaldolase family protein, partial [Anaerolineae bacterium]
VFATERFQALAAQGGRVQRPLWASTGTKNPAYSDVLYVVELVGLQTVNTMPPQTLVALLDHGQVRPASLEEDLDAARQTLAELQALGIVMDAVTDELEDEGVKSFADAFTALLAAVETSRQAAR